MAYCCCDSLFQPISVGSAVIKEQEAGEITGCSWG